MSQGNPRMKGALPNLDTPATGIRHIVAASFRDNEFSANELELLSNQPAKKISQSETGRSVLTFASIESVHDGGTSRLAAMEHQGFQKVQPANLSTTSQHHTKLLNRPVTVTGLAKAFWDEAQLSTDKEHFLPLDRLKSIINPKSVQELLDSLPFSRHEVKPLIQDIFPHHTPLEYHSPQQKKRFKDLPSRYRIFAILVGIDRVRDIQKFIDHGINDSVLPLTVTKDKGDSAEIRLRSMGDPDMDHAKLHKCFEDYSQRDIGLFKFHQNLINVPFFLFPGDDSTVLFYELDSSTVLPITEFGEMKRGGNGSVKKIQIHHAHHNYGGTNRKHSNPYFAVKTLHFHNDEGFQKEVEALERMSPKSKNQKPDHLVPLELAYRHGDKCCLVFPWASGNLKEYWKWHQKDPSNHGHVVWFFKQCWGLALGLRRLHNPKSYALSAAGNNNSVHTADDILSFKYGRHGDIKPDNILWFDNYNGDPDHLAICDFGSTEFNNLNTKSLVDANQVCGYSKTYQPPDNHTDPKISQRFDIWSLGCVFLEFVSWFLLGYRATVKDFCRERMMANPELSNDIYREDQFFHYISSGEDGKEKVAKLNPGVVNWITRLHGLQSCPSSLHKFLHLIEYGMLQPRAADRSDSMQVRLEVQSIYNECRGNQAFATAGYAQTYRDEIEYPGLNKPPHQTDREYSNVFPKLVDHMLISAPAGARFDDEIGDHLEVSNRRREGFGTERETQNQAFVPPKLPTHSTNGATGGSNELNALITGATTRCPTETDESEVDPENSLLEHLQDGTYRDSWKDLTIKSLPPSRKISSNNIIRQHQGGDKNVSMPIVSNPKELRGGDEQPKNETMPPSASTKPPSYRHKVQRRAIFLGPVKRMLKKTKGILNRLSSKSRSPKGRV